MLLQGGGRLRKLTLLTIFAGLALSSVSAQQQQQQQAAAVSDATDAEKQAAQSKDSAKSGEALEDAVEANSEAQDFKESANPVKAQVVKQAAAVMLASGTGDIDTTGSLQSSLACMQSSNTGSPLLCIAEDEILHALNTICPHSLS